MHINKLRLPVATVLALVLAGSVITVTSPAAEASITDCTGFVSHNSTTNTWSLSNQDIHKDVQLTTDGRFVQTRLANLVSGREMMASGTVGGEFQIAKQSPRVEYRGDVPGWTFDSHDCSVEDVDGDSLPDRADLAIQIHNSAFRVTAHYTVWKGHSLIEQRFDYQNVSGAAMTIADPLILNTRFLSSDMAAGQVDVTYFTGGHDDPTGLHPVTVTPGSSWLLDLETTYTGAREYLPEVIYRNRVHNDGLLIGWSYTGGTFTRLKGDGTVHVDAYGANSRTIANNETWTMATAHIMAFTGDLDGAGNTYKNFQYRYKWDLTNDAWVASAKPYNFPAPWNTNLGSFSNAGMFGMTQVWREMGADIWHLDAGWHGEGGNLNFTGNWNNTTGANLTQLGSFSEKSGMGLMVWLPPWDASPASTVYASNPSWRVSTSTPSFCEWGGGSLRMDNPAAVAWMRNLLDAKTAEFGSNWIWRQDMGAKSFDGPGINPILANVNYFGLMDDFRADNPGAGINVNLCGGNLLSLESIRQSDISQVTDGQPGQWSSWTPSFLYPQDKFWGWDFGTSQAAIVAQLQRGVEWNGWTATANPGATQLWTKYIDIYHFMKEIGLAGRWSQLYHPTVTGENAENFVQRMNAANTAGVIVPARDNYVAGGVTVYPKGLLPGTNYTVRFQNSGATATHSGAHWMANGITSTNWGGDLVWLNVTNYPGSGTDATAPSAPTGVAKASATEMGVSGVAVTWNHSTDNNWVSRYEVLRNGNIVTTSGQVNYAFIEGGALGDTYEVRAVDGDGNKSALASGSAGNKSTTASSGYSRTQGAGGWRYESISGSTVTALTWDERHSAWYGPDYLTVGSNWMHPATATPVARTWISSSTGTATVLPASVFLTGDVDGGGPMGSGNGAQLRILRDGVQIWPATGWQAIAPIGTVTTPNLSVSVVPGTRISFVVGSNGSNAFDSVRWDPTIRFP